MKRMIPRIILAAVISLIIFGIPRTPVLAAADIGVNAYISGRGNSRESIAVWDDTQYKSDYITWIEEVPIKEADIFELENLIVSGLNEAPLFVDVNERSLISLYALVDDSHTVEIEEEYFRISYLDDTKIQVSESEDLSEIQVVLTEPGKEYLYSLEPDMLIMTLKCHYVWHERSAAGGVAGMLPFLLEDFISTPIKLSFGVEYAAQTFWVEEQELPYIFFGAAGVRRMDMETGDIYEGIAYTLYEREQDARSRENAVKDADGSSDWTVFTGADGSAWFYGIPYGEPGESLEEAQSTYWAAGPLAEDPVEITVDSTSHQRVSIVRPQSLAMEPGAIETAEEQVERAGAVILTFLVEHGWDLRKIVRVLGGLIILLSAALIWSSVRRRRKEREQLEDGIVDLLDQELDKIDDYLRREKEPHIEKEARSGEEAEKETGKETKR